MNRFLKYLAVASVALSCVMPVMAQSDLGTADYSAVPWVRSKQDRSWVHPSGMLGKAIVLYSFSFDGGVVGDIDLDAYIPTNAIVYNVLIDVVDPVQPYGTSYTNGLRLNSTGDILADSTNSLRYVGRIPGIPISAATSVKSTAQRTLKLTRGGGAITSGVVMVYLDWVRSLNVND